jgi:hypothetical protein
LGRRPGPEEDPSQRSDDGRREALRTEAPSIVGVSPIHRMLAATMRYQDKQTDTPILSASRLTTSLSNAVRRQRRFINDIDMQDRSNVVIIGVDVKQALFPYEDPSTRKSDQRQSVIASSA